MRSWVRIWSYSFSACNIISVYFPFLTMTIPSEPDEGIDFSDIEEKRVL